MTFIRFHLASEANVLSGEWPAMPTPLCPKRDNNTKPTDTVLN